MTEPTTQPIEEPIDFETCWALLERLAGSSQLKRATRLRELLLYVGQSSLKEGRGQVHEQEIGAKVFGRPEGYDTSVDNIVRTNVSDLRKRIENYFNAEGQDEPVVMEIPRGSYLPVFHRRPTETANGADNSEAANNAEAETAPQLAVWQRPRWELAVTIAAAVVIVALSAGCFALWNELHTAGVSVFPATNSAAVAEFWEPILREKGDILICAGGNVLAPNAVKPMLGVITAGKDIDYPYFSITTVSAVAMLSSLIEGGGATPRFAFAATTPLPQFHEHPVILINAYNNHWTLRLAEPLRFHFSPELGEINHSILDRMRPDVAWKRDTSVPYESADDYGLVARFWDSTTDNWVLILAGLGRNGTEAAAQVVTSPQYLEMLRQQAGTDFTNRNVEAVLKLSVIEGKTGAPTIVAVHVW
jgi:hypothetical protein